MKSFQSWLQSTMDKKENKGQKLAEEKKKLKCAYCQRLFDEYYIEKTKDHVIALSKGGFDRKENRIYACYDCNQWKNNKSLEKWLDEIKHIVKKKRIRLPYNASLLNNMIKNVQQLIDYVDDNNKKISTYKNIE